MLSFAISRVPVYTAIKLTSTTECVSTHLGDMQNRVAALFVMSNAVVFVYTLTGTGGLFR